MKKYLMLSLILMGCNDNPASIPSETEVLQVSFWDRKVAVVRDNNRGATCYVTGEGSISCVHDLDTRYPLPCLDATSHDPVGHGVDIDLTKKVCK